MKVLVYEVEGHDPTPDGYHDDMLYRGRSMWGVLRAVRAGLRNGMDVVVRIAW